MSDDNFPTTTIDSVEFTGAGAMKANYKGEIKFEVDNLPKVLVQLQETHATKGKLVFISEQGQLPAAGNGADTWADTSLQIDDERELEYAAQCIGGECPHFCVPKEGDLANQFVCYLDPDALMVIEHGVTRCPLFPDATTDGTGDADEAGSDSSTSDQVEIGEPDEDEEPMAARGAGVVIVLYPGDDDPHVTQVGDHTLYGELVFDYFAEVHVDSADPTQCFVVGEDDGNERDLEQTISVDDYGKRLVVRENEAAA